MARAKGRCAVAGGLVLAAIALAACTSTEASEGGPIEISGSSTVAPITRAMASQGGYAVEVAAEGTLDGFERFCAGESVINDASEAIPGAGQETDYVSQCEENGVEFVELPIALDALTVVRNIENDFATDLTMEELAEIWSPDSGVSTWADVRPEWPDREINLYGRPTGSGTFDYFTYRVTGEAGSIRSDYEATDDTDILANWVAEDVDGLAFMGVGNYLSADGEDRDRITNIDIDGVAPSRENAQDDSYPLTRPLFLYVAASALADDAGVKEFVEYYVNNVEGLLPRVYYFALPHEVYPLLAERVEVGTTGTLFGGDPFADLSALEALQG